MIDTFDAVNDTRALPGREGLVNLVGFAARGKEVARKFHAKIQLLPVPETDAGRSAENSMERQARRPFDLIAAEERRVLALPRNLSLFQSTRALDRLELVLAEASLEMIAIDGPIMQEVPELKEPFAKADSCKELDGLGSEVA
jgi:hypothetical protein